MQTVLFKNCKLFKYCKLLLLQILAERAAWNFMENLQEPEKFELSVINPGYMMGPDLCGAYVASLQVRHIKQKDFSSTAHLYFHVVFSGLKLCSHSG